MIRAVIFDLDKCLAPPEEIGRAFFEPALEAIRRANDGHMNGDALEMAFRDFFRLAYDDVAKRYGFSRAMVEAGWAVFSSLRVPGPLHGYGDLDVLGEFSVPLVLVTTGFREFQESKVDALGIRERFDEVIVDAIDESPRIGKLGIFEALLSRRGWRPGEALVVGDNPDSEIAAGNRLGMPTLQMLRPGVPRAPSATRHARNLSEVRDLVDRLINVTDGI